MENETKKKIEIPVFDIIKPQIKDKMVGYFNEISLVEKSENLPKITLTIMLMQKKPLVRDMMPYWYFEVSIGKHEIVHEVFFCNIGIEAAYKKGLAWFLDTIDKLKTSLSYIDGNIEMIV